jgi:hypothetical protein
LPGEFTCNWRVSVVKVHPHTHPFSTLGNGGFNSDANKCKRGGVDRFNRAVLLIRDPFDSIWSEYQRRLTQSHVHGIKRFNFDWSRWQANAASLSNNYAQMWKQQYMGIEKKFKKYDILYIKYEDLKRKSTRVATLESVVNFLGISASLEKLECAFLLAESTKAHRSIDPLVEMTKEVAYTKELSCRMWSLFGKFAQLHNYTSWKQFDCTGFEALQNINVGPQGEYNRKWVKPGAKLVDFGGHEESSFQAEKEKSAQKKVKIQQPEYVNKIRKKLVINKELGMTPGEASSVVGLSKVGLERPAWD